MKIERMRELLEAALPPKRFKHSLRVYETALDMGRALGLESEQLAVSALLHDCGREVPTKQSAARADELGIAIDAVERSQQILLHAKLGVYYARTKYEVTDPQVLEGILFHTTGAAGMSALAKTVFLADMIEPARDFPGVDELRKLAYKDLDRAMLLAYSNTIRYLLAQGLLIHPQCIAGYNELLLQREGGQK